MTYTWFSKFISMMIYPLPIYVLFKDFGIGQGNGGCALFPPIGFRGIPYFQAQKSGGVGVHGGGGGGSNHIND